MIQHRYRCPHCGKMVTFGEHLCLVNGTKDGQISKFRPAGSSDRLKRIGVILVVATLTGGMLWPFLGIYALFVGLIIMAVIALVLSIITRSHNSGGQYYRKILTMVGGQKDIAERLISGEERKHPSMTRAECIRRVHDQMEYERRR